MAPDVLIEPIVTEKSNNQRKAHKYAFRVSPGATKSQILREVAQLFNVTPIRCNVMTVSRKPKRLRYRLGRTAEWKKAIITLPADQIIQIFEGA